MQDAASSLVVASVRWALDRMIELRQKGEAARFRCSWVERKGQREYRLEIRRSSGAIERPIWPFPLSDAEAVEEAAALTIETVTVTTGVNVPRPPGFYWTVWEGYEHRPEIAEYHVGAAGQFPESETGWLRTGSDETWSETVFLRGVLSGPLAAPQAAP